LAHKAGRLSGVGVVDGMLVIWRFVGHREREPGKAAAAGRVRVTHCRGEGARRGRTGAKQRRKWPEGTPAFRNLVSPILQMPCRKPGGQARSPTRPVGAVVLVRAEAGAAACWTGRPRHAMAQNTPDGARRARANPFGRRRCCWDSEPGGGTSGQGAGDPRTGSSWSSTGEAGPAGCARPRGTCGPALGLRYPRLPDPRVKRWVGTRTVAEGRLW